MGAGRRLWLCPAWAAPAAALRLAWRLRTRPHAPRSLPVHLCPQVEGLGIASAAQLFTEFGYQRRDEYHFPSKKLRVRMK